MPTRLQVLIPIGIAAVIVGVAGIVSLPSAVTIDANSNFLMGTVQLDDKLLQVYIADTDPRRMRGLMFETESFLSDDKGMLFVFEQPDMVCFWMKNTLIPLSAAFIANDGRIVNIANMQANSTEPHCTKEPVRLVLEMNQGWFAQRGIRAGTIIDGLR